MNDQIRQIAQRLVGLREAIDASPREVAEICGISEQEYLNLESGEKDIPVSILHNISQHYSIELSALMFGADAHANAYFVTRKGQGQKVERTKAYGYESLAAGFTRRDADPFMVTVEPKDAPITLNTHSGQEFNYIIEGKMELQIGNSTLILEEGDSVYFNSMRPHGMKALGGEKVKFIAIIL